MLISTLVLLGILGNEWVLIMTGCGATQVVADTDGMPVNLVNICQLSLRVNVRVPWVPMFTHVDGTRSTSIQ